MKNIPKFKFWRNILALSCFSMLLFSFLPDEDYNIVTNDDCISSMSYLESAGIDFFHEDNLDFTELNGLDFNQLNPANHSQEVKLCKTTNGNFINSTTLIESNNIYPKWKRDLYYSETDMNGTRLLDEDGNLLSELPADSIDYASLSENIQMLEEICEESHTQLLPIPEDVIQILRDSGHTVNIFESIVEIIYTWNERVLISSSTMEIWETIPTDLYDIAVYTKYKLHTSGRLLQEFSREVNRVILNTDHCIERHITTAYDNYQFEGECSNTGVIDQSQSRLQVEFEQKISVNEPSVTAYPSPGNGSLTLNLSGFDIDKKKNIEVFDVFGKNLRSDQTGVENSYTLNLEYATPGVYFIKVWQGQKFALTQFIKK